MGLSAQLISMTECRLPARPDELVPVDLDQTDCPTIVRDPSMSGSVHEARRRSVSNARFRVLVSVALAVPVVVAGISCGRPQDTLAPSAAQGTSTTSSIPAPAVVDDAGLAVAPTSSTRPTTTTTTVEPSASAAAEPRRRAAVATPTTRRRPTTTTTTMSPVTTTTLRLEDPPMVMIIPPMVAQATRDWTFTISDTGQFTADASSDAAPSSSDVAVTLRVSATPVGTELEASVTNARPFIAGFTDGLRIAISIEKDGQPWWTGTIADPGVDQLTPGQSATGSVTLPSAEPGRYSVDASIEYVLDSAD